MEITTSMPQAGTFQRFIRVYTATLEGLRRTKDLSAKNPVARATLFHEMARWSSEILHVLNIEVGRRGAHPSKEPVLFVGNHISYIDIPLLMSATPTVFVGKKELLSWPVFGRGFRVLGTVPVDRTNKTSRAAAGLAIAQKILIEKRSVAVFPSGTTSLREDTPWKRGTFQIAFDHGIKIQPFRITYHPLHTAAYIGRDFFPFHLMRLLQHPKISATLDFHEPVEVTDPENDSQRWREWTTSSLR